MSPHLLRVRGHALSRNIFKWCNLVRFRVIFAEILSKNYKNIYFLYKNNRYCITAHCIMCI